MSTTRHNEVSSPRLIGMTTTRTTATLVLDVHICDQRRSYRATFCRDEDAAAFIAARGATHAFTILNDEDDDLDAFPATLDVLFPSCEHGLSAWLCAGPGHYPMDHEI